ncbi:hypothetical protein ACOJQI_15960 [Bacillus salacetis]|uniref:hypothetical protein n=1 Tax=Bacillus salacetis TaxID=2315464 RepID=UPI003B9EFEF5
MKQQNLFKENDHSYTQQSVVNPSGYLVAIKHSPNRKQGFFQVLQSQQMFKNI